MEVVITCTTPLYRSQQDHGVFVQWHVESPPTTGIASFKIERSGSSDGPFELVRENVIDFHVFDNLRHAPEAAATAYRENLNFLSLKRTVYYRVTALAVDGSTATTTRPVGADIVSRKIALLRRKMQRDLAISFKFNSVELAILKRRHWGIRCPVCFDLLTKRVTKSKCDSCYGTGFTGGYFDPVRVRGRVGTDNVQTNITPQGKGEVNQKRLTLGVVPLLEHDDIIVTVKQNERYIVQHQHATEMQTVAVHQQVTISEISRDSIEYRIPVNTDYTPVIY